MDVAGLVMAALTDWKATVEDENGRRVLAMEERRSAHWLPAGVFRISNSSNVQARAVIVVRKPSALPAASSVFSVLSGPRNIARVEYDPFLKKALAPFLAKGASISPTYCAYDDETTRASLLLLFGLPKIPELHDILEEAKALIQLHSGDSELKQHWFKLSKGTTRKELNEAVNDLEKLLGYYIKPD